MQIYFLVVVAANSEPDENEVEFDDDCPKNVPIFGCDRNYCKTSSCPNYENAECRLSVCGECKPVYYVNSQKVNCNAPIGRGKKAGI